MCISGASSRDTVYTCLTSACLTNDIDSSLNKDTSLSMLLANFLCLGSTI